MNRRGFIEGAALAPAAARLASGKEITIPPYEPWLE